MAPRANGEGQNDPTGVGTHGAAAENVGGEGAAVPATAAAGRTEAQPPRAGRLAHFRIEMEAQLTQMMNQNVHLNSEQLRLQSEQARVQAELQPTRGSYQKVIDSHKSLARDHDARYESLVRQLATSDASKGALDQTVK